MRASSVVSMNIDVLDFIAKTLRGLLNITSLLSLAIIGYGACSQVANFRMRVSALIELVGGV